MIRNVFPSKYAPRGAEQPIRGNLDSMRIPDEQQTLIERITIGLFLDMQNKPLAEILAACYISGVQHAVAAMQESSHGQPLTSEDEALERNETREDSV